MPDGFPFEFETEGFRKWTELAIKEVERDMAGKALRAIAFEFIKRVIEKTPVDFGRARAGWASYAISKGRSPRLGGKKEKRGGLSQAVGIGHGGTDPQKQGLEEGSFTESLRGSDQFIELINGVPYIVILEFGSSDQAPGGMMRITFKEMEMAAVMTKEMKKELVKTFTEVNQKLRLQRAG